MKDMIINFFISVIGFMLIWAATDVYRPNDSIRLFSFNWWIQLVLIAIGTILITYKNK